MPIKRSMILVICLKELNKLLRLRSHPFDSVAIKELQSFFEDVRWYRRPTVYLSKVIQVFVAGAGPVLNDVVAQAIEGGMARYGVSAKMNGIKDKIFFGGRNRHFPCDGRLLDYRAPSIRSHIFIL